MSTAPSNRLGPEASGRRTGGRLFRLLPLLALLLPAAAGQAAAEQGPTLRLLPEHLPAAARDFSTPPPDRDPFRWGDEVTERLRAASQPEAGDPFAGIELQGILYDPRQPLAILNEALIGPGESIGSVRILEIQPGQVILGHGDRRHTLGLGNGPLPESPKPDPAEPAAAAAPEKRPAAGIPVLRPDKTKTPKSTRPAASRGAGAKGRK